MPVSTMWCVDQIASWDTTGKGDLLPAEGYLGRRSGAMFLVVSTRTYTCEDAIASPPHHVIYIQPKLSLSLL